MSAAHFKKRVSVQGLLGCKGLTKMQKMFGNYLQTWKIAECFIFTFYTVDFFFKSPT